MTMGAAKFMLVLWAALGISALGQGTLYVPSTAYPTIQAAINAAVAGDTIQVAAGTYFENLVWGNADISVIGAGKGLSVIDGGGSAPCVTFLNVATSSSMFQGFTLQNGLGLPEPVGNTTLLGGAGVYMKYVGSGPQSNIIKDCRITACVADGGSGVYALFASNVVIDGTDFIGNTANPAGGMTTGVVSGGGPGTSITVRSSSFQGNSGTVAILESAFDGSLTVEDCSFTANAAGLAVVRSSATNQGISRVSRTEFSSNTISGPNSSVIELTGPSALTVRDCLLAGNQGGSFLIFATGSSSSVLQNITLADNSLASTTGSIFATSSMSLRNTITWGNRDVQNSLPSLHVPWGQNATLTFSNLIIEGSSSANPSVSSLDPLFHDAANGDYRPLPGSFAINGGTSLGVSANDIDLDGNSRLLLGQVDIGCYEGATIAYHPCAAGRVGESAGGPYDIMRINGSGGGPLRRVTIPVGTAATLEMSQPPSSLNPVDFSIFGVVGEANLDTVCTVPLGIGEMGFAPAPAAPLLQPILFTYASSVGTINGVSPFLATSPTPWAAGPGPVIPIPLILTFQGVIAEGLNVFTPTNLIVFKVE
ncbi:MAG: right-handed parallel beta-helix repeat-containing protein [Planctomycetes bacterium]|nr:right-handed parallel beta-helix repeat-containing protein [Planctomycetota bacterium]